MRGTTMSVARWVGMSIVLSSCILVLGLRWPVLRSAPPDAPSQPPSLPVAEEATQAEPISAADSRRLLEQIGDWLSPCYTNEYSSTAHAEHRARELLRQSEDLRKLEEEWDQIWYDGGMTDGESVDHEEPKQSQPMSAEEARKLLAPISAWLDTPAYAADPIACLERLLEESEDLREIEAEWERIWYGNEKTPINSAALLRDALERCKESVKNRKTPGETVERLPPPRSE